MVTTFDLQALLVHNQVYRTFWSFTLLPLSLTGFRYLFLRLSLALPPRLFLRWQTAFAAMRRGVLRHGCSPITMIRGGWWGGLLRAALLATGLLPRQMREEGSVV